MREGLPQLSRSLLEVKANVLASVRSAVAVTASSAASGCASSSRRAQPVHGLPTGRLHAAAVPEPGASRQPGRRCASSPAVPAAPRKDQYVSESDSESGYGRGYAHPRRGAICAQELRGPAQYVLE
jgi:hypothetical protein